MIYRNKPRQPTRLLLRVVVAAGTIINLEACGGDTLNGTAPNPCVDEAGNAACGLTPVPDADVDPCVDHAGHFVCGLIDAGSPCLDDSGNPTCGIVPLSDAGGGLMGAIADAGEPDQ